MDDSGRFLKKNQAESHNRTFFENYDRVDIPIDPFIKPNKFAAQKHLRKLISTLFSL